jgi:hypothetical protein
MILAVLFVAIGAPNSHADSFTPVFTCDLCTSALPTAPDVSFPAPLTIEITWENTLFDVSLPSSAQPTRSVWSGSTPVAFSQFGTASFTFRYDSFSDEIVVNAPFLFQLDSNNNCLNCDVMDFGNVQFAPDAAPSVPEPSSVVLMLAGIGFLLVMMPKRLA